MTDGFVGLARLPGPPRPWRRRQAATGVLDSIEVTRTHMTGPNRVRTLLAPALAGMLGAVVLAQEPSLAPRRENADHFERKIERIQRFAATPPTARVGQRTVMTQPEVNAYLWWHLDDVVPKGITDPSLQLLGDGRLSGRAVVDLSAIRDQKVRGWLDPLAYVGGKVEVTAAGRLQTDRGMATLDLTSATVAGVPVPKSILQELVTHYTRTAATPQGVSLDDPFPLPAAIRQILVGKGEATVVQ